MLVVAFVIYAATGTASLAIPPAVAVGLTPRLFFQRRHAKVLAERRGGVAGGDPRRARQPRRRPHAAPLAVPARPRPGPLPLRPTWQRYERNAAALDVATALELARAELADPVSDRVIEAFVAAHEHGRDVIVAVLRSLADNVTKDLQLVEQIATGQTEIRSQAVDRRDPAVRRAGLPRRRQRRATAPSTGRPADGSWSSIGVVMAIGGWKLITVLGRIPVEERVLAGRGGTPVMDGRVV